MCGVGPYVGGVSKRVNSGSAGAADTRGSRGRRRTQLGARVFERFWRGLGYSPDMMWLRRGRHGKRCSILVRNYRYGFRRYGECFEGFAWCAEDSFFRLRRI